MWLRTKPTGLSDPQAGGSRDPLSSEGIQLHTEYTMQEDLQWNTNTPIVWEAVRLNSGSFEDHSGLIPRELEAIGNWDYEI